MGDVVSRPPDGQLPVEIGVTGAAGAVLELWGSEGLLLQHRVAEDELVLEMTLAVGASLYVRAQLVDGEARDQIRALTNPIYLRS